MRKDIDRKQKTRGFTLTEIAIVLGVIGLVLGGIWFVASMVSDNARINQAANQLGLVAQNMTSLLQGGYNPGLAPGTDITQAMITTQVIPSWAATSATQASTPWNATGFNLSWISSNPRTYRMSFHQVATARACVGLIDQVTACTPGQPGCPTAIVVAANPGTLFDLTTNTLTTLQVQALCTQNNYSGGAANSVEFNFTN